MVKIREASIPSDAFWEFKFSIISFSFFRGKQNSGFYVKSPNFKMLTITFLSIVGWTVLVVSWTGHLARWEKGSGGEFRTPQQQKKWPGLPREEVPFPNSHKVPTQTVVALLLAISGLDDRIKALTLEITYVPLIYPHIYEDNIILTIQVAHLLGFLSSSNGSWLHLGLLILSDMSVTHHLE